MAQEQRTHLDATFKKWMRESRFRLRGCDIQDFPETGRGVVATSDLPESHVLFSVPRECVLSAANSVAGEALQNAGISGWEALIIAIVVEMSYGRRSKFWPYLEALPRHLDTPVLWEEDELALLHGSAALDRLGRDEIACTVDTLMLPFLTRFFRSPPVRGLDEGRLASAVTCVGSVGASTWLATRRCCYHVGALVSAYSFTLEDGQPAMVPFADFLNHKTGHNNARLHYNGVGRALQMITTQAVQAGAELFNTYGDLSNAELLRKYAFVDAPDNAHNCVEIPAIAVLAHFYDNFSGAGGRVLGHERAGFESPDETDVLPGGRNGEMKTKKNNANDGSTRGGGHGGSQDKRGSRADLVAGGKQKKGSSHSARPDDAKEAVRSGYPHTMLDGDGGVGTGLSRWRALLPEGDIASINDKAMLREWDVASINDKAALLEEVGIMPPDHVFQIPRDGSPPPDLVESVRVLLMCTGPGRGCFRALHRSLMLNRMPPPQPLWRLDASVTAAIAAIARQRLALLPMARPATKEQGDSAGFTGDRAAHMSTSLGPGTHAWRCQAAAAVVQGEREILERLVGNMEEAREELADQSGPQDHVQAKRIRLEKESSVRRDKPVAVMVGPAVWPVLGGRHAKLAVLKEATWWRRKRKELAGQ